MVIEVRVCGEGEVAADFTGGRVILAEEGHVAVTIHDTDRQETAVLMLSPEEAEELAAKLTAEARKGRTAQMVAAGRALVARLSGRDRTTAGARTYAEQGGPW